MYKNNTGRECIMREKYGAFYTGCICITCVVKVMCTGDCDPFQEQVDKLRHLTRGMRGGGIP